MRESLVPDKAIQALGSDVVTVGDDVAPGAAVGVGVYVGAQADRISLTGKNTINMRFIFRVFLWRSVLSEGLRLCPGSTADGR